MRLTMAPYCAAISPADCVPAMPSACTVCSAESRKAAAAPAAAENTPTVAPECQPCADMLRAHAFADARADLVAGDGGAQEIAAAHAGPQLGDREQRRQA